MMNDACCSPPAYLYIGRRAAKASRLLEAQALHELQLQRRMLHCWAQVRLNGYRCLGQLLLQLLVSPSACLPPLLIWQVHELTVCVLLCMLKLANRQPFFTICHLVRPSPYLQFQLCCVQY